MTREDDAASGGWHKIRTLWETVREMPPAELDAFLASNSAYGALRREIESLFPGAERTHGSAHAEADPLVGTTVGHYEIAARLGEGGMGVVYRALDLRLQRPVALKLLHARTPNDLRAKQRLLVEARAAAALDHPNICTIYEVGETADQSAFIAMAFYPGETLEQMLQRGPLSPATAVDYATQIARGLGAAHARGIIHRDVKPANIIIATGDVVKLLDFGIARVPDVDVSRDGVAPGTIAYMSPEQVASRPLDLRTDLWSLGVVLYEMCAGVRPFRGDNVAAVLHAILHGSPATLRSQSAGPVDSIIARLLAKDPDHRYRNTEQLISDLVRSAEVASEPFARPGEPVAVSTDVSVATGRTRGRWSRRALWYGVATVAAGALLMTWRGSRARSGSELNAPAITVPNKVADSSASAARLHAQDLYTRGLTPVLFRTDSGRRAARDLLRQAAAADPTFAPAHAALAILSTAPGSHTRASLEEAERSARTAIRLDSTQANAQAALGRVMMLRYRFAEAETHLRRAVELDPKSDLREFLIWLYVFMERPDDVLREAEELLRHNPTVPAAIAEVARGHLVNGRCDEALAQLDRISQIRPPPARAGHIAAQCHATRNEWPQAIAAMRRVAAGNEQALAYLGFMLARGGQADSARAISATLLARHARGEASAWSIAVIYAGLGDVDRAFDWLARAYDDWSLRHDIMEPLFEELRADARFNRLRGKLNLPER